MLDLKKIFINMSTICDCLYRVQILTQITPSKVKKNTKGKICHIKNKFYRQNKLECDL